MWPRRVAGGDDPFGRILPLDRCPGRGFLRSHVGHLTGPRWRARGDFERTRAEFNEPGAFAVGYGKRHIGLTGSGVVRKCVEGVTKEQLQPPLMHSTIGSTVPPSACHASHCRVPPLPDAGPCSRCPTPCRPDEPGGWDTGRRGRPATARRLALAVLIAACLGSECHWRLSINNPQGRTTLIITTVTAGARLDRDGYTVTVRGGGLVEPRSWRFQGNDSEALYFDGASGTHVVELGDIEDNCTVGGQNPRSINLERGARAEIVFEIVCYDPAP